MKVQMGKTSVDLRPFVGVAILWLLVCAGILLGVAGDPAAALKVGALFYVLALSDLFFLVKTIAAAVVLMSDQGAENGSAYAIQAFVYGGLKLMCLGAIGISLWKFSEAPSLGILLGLSALVVVPLGGGFWWSQIQIREAESAG